MYKLNWVFARRWSSDILAVLTAAAVVFGSFGPSAVETGSIPGEDKLLHFGAYGLLAGLALLQRSTPTARLTMILAVILFGAAIEFIQPLTGRDFSNMDIAANILGTIAGASVVWMTTRLGNICRRNN